MLTCVSKDRLRTMHLGKADIVPKLKGLRGSQWN
jgi:hypothetical protein